MSTYAKITLSVLMLFLIQLYGIGVEQYNIPSALNNAWYIGSFWSSMVVGGIGLLLSMVLMFAEDGKDEEETNLKALGLKELNTWFYCKPFFVLTLVFVQCGALWVAAACFGAWAFQSAHLFQHRKHLTNMLKREAEQSPK